MLVESGAERNLFTMAALGDTEGIRRRLRRVPAEARLFTRMAPASQDITPLQVACGSDWRAHG
jgi:hypothetical protein